MNKKSLRRTWARIPHKSLGLLIFFSLLWLGPLLAGRMPTTADHTVHFARAHQWCSALENGHLRSWSSMWGFGVPLGELYPTLGDLGYCLLSTLAPGARWAYAWSFAGAFLLGIISSYLLGRSMLLTRAPRMAEVCGWLCALFWLSDLGSYREGGWVYSVLFGVWPQSLATSLAWLALLAIHHSCRRPERWPWAALCIACALLAHPIALLQLGVTVGLWALAQKDRQPLGPLITAFLVGAGLAAWWWIPMLEHRAFMANYGWLHASSTQLLKGLAKGQWTQFMPSVVGYSALIALGALLCNTQRWPRVVGACALALWFASSSSVFDELRFELWGSAWTHLQYQRFIISAKPAFFALAAMGLCLPLLLFHHARQSRGFRRLSMIALSLSLCTAGAWQAQKDFPAYKKRAKEIAWGQWPQLRLGKAYPKFETHYAGFLSWLQELQAKGERLRIHAKDQRNLHWFMDLSAFGEHRLYKSGFTPGDNFRHKPESRSRDILDRLALSHELLRVDPESQLPAGAKRWGSIELRPRKTKTISPYALLKNEDGEERTLHESLIQASEHRWSLELPAEFLGPWTVQLPLAHYPRWKVHYQGQRLSTFATPARGPGQGLEQKATLAPLGRALGNDGSSPTLLSFEAPGPGRYEIHYQLWSVTDRIALVISLVSLLALLLLARRPPLKLGEARVSRFGLAILLTLLVLLSLRIRTNLQARAEHWSERALHETLPAQRMRPGLIKSNMVIERALIARPSKDRPATLEIHSQRWSAKTLLWWSLDDDRAQLKRKDRPRYRIRIWSDKARATAPVLDELFYHRPNRHLAQLDTSALEGKRASLYIQVESTAARSSKIGLDAWPLAPKTP